MVSVALVVLALAHALGCAAFRPVPRPPPRASSGRQLVPQIVFAASCAGAVFLYVFNNIDSIKEQQRVSIEKVMAEQSDSLKAVQEQQRLNIEKAQKQQQEAIRKIKEGK